MGFNVAEYAAKKKKETGAAATAAPQAPQNSGGFSVRDYAQSRALQNGGASEKAAGYQSFRDKVVKYSDAIAADAEKRSGQFQDKTAFGSYFDTKNREAGDLLKEAYTYRDYWKQNAGAYDRLSESGTAGADYLADVEGLIEYLNGSRDALFDEERYWSGFADEEEYNGLLAQAERHDYLANYDVAAGQSALEELQAALDAADKARRNANAQRSASLRRGGTANRQAAQEAANKANAEYEEILAQVQAQQKDLNEAQQLQTGLRYQGYTDAEDYAKYAAQGAALENPSLSDVEKGVTIFGRHFGGETPQNIVTYSRDNWEQIAMGEANNSQMTGRSLYHYMTNDEVGIYNYLLAKEGQEAAQEYLDYLEETLNYRFGTAQGRNVRGIDSDIGRTLMTGLYGFGAGLDQFAGGAKRFFTGDKRPTSATQYGSAYIREDLKRTGPEVAGGSLGQMAYDATTIVGNMAPSILVSAVTAGMGAPAALASGAAATTMGVSSAGNAYAQKLDEGYSKSQARTYSTLVGAAEGGLQYLLGGIGALGGVTDDIILAKVGAIDNALARVALTGAVRIGSEITEEELQLWLEPVFASLVLDEEYHAPTFEDMAYTAIVTALSTGVLESGEIAGAARAPSAPGQTGQTEQATAEDIAAQLVEAGVDPAEAEALADGMAAVINGQEISGNQAGAIAGNEAAVSVLESVAGQEINTDAPLGQVKATIKGLASRQAAPAAASPSTDTHAPQEAESAAQSAAEDTAQLAATLGERGQKAFLTATEELGGNVPAIYKDFAMLYNLGKQADPQEIQRLTGSQIESRLPKTENLPTTNRFAAFVAGMNDAQAVAVANSATTTNEAETTLQPAENSGTMEATNPSVLNSGRDGEGGWGSVYDTANEALLAAVEASGSALKQALDTEWAAVTADAEKNGKSTLPTPITNAITAVGEDVRQGTITPARGAQILAEAYESGGVEALNALYNPKTGNLHEDVLKEHTGSEAATKAAPAAAAETTTETTADTDGEPVYVTEDPAKTADPAERKRLMQERKRTMAQATKEYGLEEKEASRLDKYVGGSLCYMLNLRARTGSLAPGDREIIDTVTAALRKFPTFEGRTYRNLQFKTQEEYDAFMQRHAAGETVPLTEFTSASKLPNGYVLTGKGVVHMVIDGSSARDIADTFGQKQQQEVIYLPGTQIRVTKVGVANDGNPLIYAQEVAAHGEVEAENGGDHGNVRPPQSNGGNGDAGTSGAPGSHDPGGEDGRVRGEAQSGSGRNDVLPERREGADAGNVPVTPPAKKAPTPLPAKTKTMLDKSLAVVVGKGKDHFLTDGYVALTVNDEQAAYAGSEWGVNAKPDGDLTAKTIRELAEKNSYAAIIGNPVEIKHSLKITGKSADVYVFEVEGGKQIGVQKKYAKYFDGFTFSAAIRDDGFPIALKVTDSDGELVGIIMPMRPNDSGGVFHYDTSEGKAVKMRSFDGKRATTKKAPAKKPAKEKAVETTVRLDDFGEKIGGARKDLWRSRGLELGDLEAMNTREREKNVKKDNVWKRPDYKKLVEGGEDRGLLWARNEIRKAVNQNPSYRYGDTAEIKAKKQALFVETVREIQAMAERATTAEDFRAMGREWLIKKGYLRDNPNGSYYSRYSYTDAYNNNPALHGSNYLQNVEYLAKNFSSFGKLADRANFAVDAKSVVPKGFSITGGPDTVGGKLVDGEWVQDTSYAVCRGRMIIKAGFPTYEEALAWLQQAVAKKKGKTRFVPEQLLEVHRKGPDYRGSKNVAGQDYLDTFAFRGGEFGNWLNEKDRQVSLNYGFDALKDLADALGVADSDISFGGNLNIAFGARGQGLSGAAAHYERDRHVINLTKMNGAGSLAHEWFHALDDYIGGYGEHMATDRVRTLPENSREAMRSLINAMQYTEATQEETDLAATKRHEQAVRGVTYAMEGFFKWVKKLDAGTLTEADTQYFKRKPTAEDAARYHYLMEQLLATGDNIYVTELSNLRKEVYGHVIPKEEQVNMGHRLWNLRPEATQNVQRGTKRTDFYLNSQKFGNLHAKDGDYWDSTVEMAARAFACYVADKTGKANDYLSAHSDSAVTLDVDRDGNPVIVRAYPVGEERAKINDAFDDLIAALKEDGLLHERETTAKPADIQYSILDMAAAIDPARWSAKRIGKEKPMTLSELIEKIRHDFGINITTGHIRGKGVQGQYNRRDKGIRTRSANDLPTVCHELGHALDDRFKITGSGLTTEMHKELEKALGALAAGYDKKLYDSEGLAEYLRQYLQNKDVAAIDYPEFTRYFKGKLDGKTLALVEQLANDVNAYFALDADTATSSIRLREEGGPDFRTPVEKMQDKSDALYQAWNDANHGIKLFDEATGSNVYKLATNSAYSDAIAGRIITGDLTDANGQYVGPGLKTALQGINTRNKQEYLLFNEYLVVRHGQEYLAEGMRVFADDRKNSVAFMKQRQAELERQYPQFEAAAKRLYQFLSDLNKTWGVSTQVISKEQLADWQKRWPDYVPFYRALPKEGRSGRPGAKRGYANQTNPHKKAKGGGQDIISPVDNIIDQIVLLVNVGTRNNVMYELRNAALNLGADASLMEQIPTPMVPKQFDMSGVKETLFSGLGQALQDGSIKKDSEAGIDKLISGLSDVMMQFERGKPHDKVVTVMVGGKPEFWKVNDPLLLESVANLSPAKLRGWLEVYAKTTRFMTANITGNNPVWSIFSNAPRDLMTFAVYSKDKRPFKAAAALGTAYINAYNERFRGGKGVDPLYHEYLAMGGGHTSAYSADADLAKKARQKLTTTRAQRVLDATNPINWVSFISDTIEQGPRFATYKLMRQAGLSPQEAFYEAMDVTVNFRRGGVQARELNKAVPFFNASIQGIDKFGRFFTGADAAKGDRAKVVRNRWIAYVAGSAAIAAMIYALNNGDDEEEKEYQQLSNYTKNTYWCIPLGDGKYFTISKPRELAVLSSFLETCMERFIGENEHAFDEFYDYATDNFLPSIVSDLAQLPSNIVRNGVHQGLIDTAAGALGSAGLFGVGAYMVANRDFLGKPIESATLQYLEPKDRYNNTTSKMAYWLGQAFDLSPVMVDYFGNQVLGYLWKVPKAWFPYNTGERDISAGVVSTYVKDNAYSQDLVNWLYDQADKSAMAKKSAPKDMDKAITAKLDSSMTGFYSNFNKLNRDKADTEERRHARNVVLEMVSEYRESCDAGTTTRAQQAVYAVVKATGDTSYMPSVLGVEVKDGNGVKHQLTDIQYTSYQTQYLAYYWDYAEQGLKRGMSDQEKAAVLNAAKSSAKEQATNEMLRRIGAPETRYAEKYSGVDTEDVIQFRAQTDLADDDGGLNQGETKAILEIMLENGDISKTEAYLLFRSTCSKNDKGEISDKNNPWKKHKP